MNFARGGTAAQMDAGDRILACLSLHGSAAHSYVSGQALLRGPRSSRNLADAAAFLCSLHGRTPGILAYAAAGATDAGAKLWLEDAALDFAVERALLARLAVEAGSAPATPGGTGVEATLRTQRQSLDRLAGSERQGCGLGAAIALLADWGAVRFVLNTAAGRFGVVAPPSTLPDEGTLAAVATRLAVNPAVERAMLFGAEQMLLQHHGLWDILEARQLAREG